MRNLFLKSILLIGLFSFFMHFFWEWFQCVPFFVHRGNQAVPASMVKAALGDVGLTFLVIGLTFILSCQKITEYRFRLKNFLFLELIAFFTAASVEKIALAINRWSYTEINPVIPGLKVSLLPVLQLMLLIPLALYLTAVILRKPA